MNSHAAAHFNFKNEEKIIRLQERERLRNRNTRIIEEKDILVNNCHETISALGERASQAQKEHESLQISYHIDRRRESGLPPELIGRNLNRKAANSRTGIRISDYLIPKLVGVDFPNILCLTDHPGRDNIETGRTNPITDNHSDIIRKYYCNMVKPQFCGCYEMPNNS